MDTFIYELSFEGVPFYIGKSMNPKQRLREHIYKARHFCNRPISVKIRSILEKGRPEINVIDTTPDEDSPFWERYWHQQYTAWGFDLTNGHTHFEDPTSHPTTRNKKVVMDNQVTFESIAQAARNTKSDPSVIIKVCKGKYKQHKGHTWRYWSSADIEDVPF